MDMGFSKLTKFYVVNVCFMDDCVGGGGGGGKEGVGKKWGREMFCFGLCPDASMRPYWVQKGGIF